MICEHAPVQDDISVYSHCARCGARVGSYDYTQPCPIIPVNNFGTKQASDVLADAVRLSAFDRMDRLYRNKKD